MPLLSQASKNLRRGKGKMRNRRYVARKGPLLVVASDAGIARAARNLPGVEIASVDRLNLLQVRSRGGGGRGMVGARGLAAGLRACSGVEGLESSQHGRREERVGVWCGRGQDVWGRRGGSSGRGGFSGCCQQQRWGSSGVWGAA